MTLWLRLSLSLLGAAAVGSAGGEEAAPTAPTTVSYVRDVRPIFQSHCQGCHQPARSQGGYVMTDAARLLAGGESGEVAVVAGDPEASPLVAMITPTDGEAAMPQGKPPLTEAEIELVRRWIAAGAVDDTPQQTRPQYSADNPPAYSRPPVIPSMDFAPDGSVLAVAGFHEVLLIETSDWQLKGRLVGLSERIESVRFSPDGSRLLATGGQPGRMGEVQIWDVAEQRLQLSVPVTFDTIYGGCWSPDGSLVAFGCADNTVRALDAQTGEQRLFQGAHEDWVRTTVFIPDGSHLVSAGLDMTVKLTEVATERFIDNITSITPGALRGGINALARHPERNEVVVGGADGAAKIYRVFRETERKIGDDANLVRRLPDMSGRIFSVAVSPDGKYLAAIATLDGHSQVRVWQYDLEASLPDEIRVIHRKRFQDRSDEERKKLEQHVTAALPVAAEVAVSDTALYAAAFDAQGRLAVAGADGQVRVFKADGGELLATFSPAPLGGEEVQMPTPSIAEAAEQAAQSLEDSGAEPQVEPRTVVRLDVQPATVQLSGSLAYAQLCITAELKDGSQRDVTRAAQLRMEGTAATVDSRGVVRGVADGNAKLIATIGKASAEIAVSVSEMQQPLTIDFVRDVNPVLSRLGCNQGTCHGAAKGRNGFKLSLRGYDAIFDVRSLTDDLASRRVNVAAPDSSLMLMKALGEVPHEGGQLFKPGSDYHRIVRQWIADGCPLDLEVPRVQSLAIAPQQPVIGMAGQRQQVRVTATYSDGATRDVTAEAFIESGNSEVATVDRFGLLTAVRRGEAAILARFEGAYAAATLTVMGQRDGFQWEDPPTWGRIDELVAEKWKRLKILPSELASDAEFVRRVHLDLTGLPPTIETIRTFLADDRPTQTKRSELVEQLIGSEAYVEYWTNKWSDLLQVNSKFLGREGATALRQWIRQHVHENTPYDQFVRQILTATGSNKDNPAASYYKILRTPEETMENTTHLFLAVRFNCNKCHDHPFERWTQDQYFETAAYFAQFGLKRDPASGDRNIGGTAVEGAKPLYEEVFDKTEGAVTHERTGQPVDPAFPYPSQSEVAEDAPRRQQLAAWMTSSDNQYFAKSYVNRLWGYLMGVGIIEPIDDIRAGNPPTNPELLDYLTDEFINSNFDARHVMRLICKNCGI